MKHKNGLGSKAEEKAENYRQQQDSEWRWQHQKNIAFSDKLMIETVITDRIKYLMDRI